MGRTDVADALLQLDKLTQEEVRMVAAQNLKATHGVDEKVTVLGSKMCGVDDRLSRVEDSMKGVKGKVDRVLNSARLVSNWSSNCPNTLHTSNSTNSKRLWWSALYVTSSVLPKVVKAQAFVQGKLRQRMLENGSLLRIPP